MSQSPHKVRIVTLLGAAGLAWFLVLNSLSGLTGCSRSPAPGHAHDRFVPAPETARQAVDAVLRAWQEGAAPGMIPNMKPQVHISDAHRKAGQRLKTYQILGAVPGDAPRCFAVKATFSNPAAEERIRFVVIGIDPLWVFRHEDLELLTHWEHKMDPVPDQKAADKNATENNATDKNAPEKK